MFNETTFNGAPFNASTATDAALPAGYKVRGAVLEMDLGTGALEVIPPSSLAPNIKFSSSLDGYGVQELSFTLIGDRAPSPIKRGLFRGQCRTRLTFYRGIPGAVSSAVLFDGYTREVRWQDLPQQADVVAQDVSLKFADATVFYQLAAFAGKTRTQVLADVLAGVPTGVIDCPGTVYKAIQEGGDKALLQWLASFVAPAARRAYWRAGVLYVQPTALGVRGRTLRPADVRGPIRVTMPNTDTPNTIRQSALVYGYLGAPGTYSIVTSVSTYGTYTPAAAVRKQNHSTGAITSVSPSVTAQTELTRTVTTTTYSGGTVTGQTIENWSWYAPKACSIRQNVGTGLTWPAMPTTRYNDGFDVYEFGTSGSGDWRSQDTETFMITRKTVIAKAFGGTGILSYVTTSVFRVTSQFVGAGRGAVVSSSPWTVNWTADLYIGREGNAWDGGYESLIEVMREVRVNALTGGSTGALANVTANYYSYKTSGGMPGFRILSTPNTSGLCYFIGSDGSIAWCAAPIVSQQVGAFQNYTLTYTNAADGTSHTESLGATYYLPSGWPSLIVTQAMANWPCLWVDYEIPYPVSAAGTVPGTSPYPETLTSQQVPQPATVTMSSAVLTALNGSVTTTDQNDFAESSDEVSACALDWLRQNCSPQLEIHTDPDSDILAGDVLTLSGFDRLSDGDIPVIVDQVDVTFNLATAAGERVLTCRVYPPELGI